MFLIIVSQLAVGAFGFLAATSTRGDVGVACAAVLVASLLSAACALVAES